MRLLTAMVMVMLIGSTVAQAAEPPRIEVGKAFPAISLPALEDGSPMSIRDFRGEKVVLHVFASW